MPGIFKKKKKSFFIGGLGLLLLVIGVVAGKILLTSITNKVKEELCIESSSHKGYKDWIGDSSKREENFQIKVYYWNITNIDGFLYYQEVPKLQEVGPYIYRFAFEKINVTFLFDSYQYQKMKQIEYDDSATRKECQDCSEHDVLSLVNVGYVATMWLAGSDVNFAYSVIPPLLKNIISTENDLENMGQTDVGFPANCTLFPQGWKINFADYTNKNYSLIEMRGLYHVIQSSEILGVRSPPPTFCQEHPINTTCLRTGFLPLLNSLSNRKQIVPFANLTTDVIFITIFGQIAHLFCPNTTYQCFNITSSDVLDTVATYITVHLVKLAMHAMIDRHNYGLITTRKQSEHSVGWMMTELKLPEYPKGIPVPGLIGNDSDKTIAEENLKFESYFKCDEDGEKGFRWKSYAGMDVVNSTYFYNSTNDFRQISGQYSLNNLGMKKTLQVCSFKQENNAKTFHIFEPAFYTTLKADYVSQDTVHSVHVENFQLDLKHLYDVNNQSVFVEGLFDATSTTQLPMLLSAPHYLGENKDLTKRFSMNPDAVKHLTTYKVEPITGILFGLDARLQVNTAITKKMISAPRLKPLNVSYVNDNNEKFTKPFPVMWTDIHIVPTEEDAKVFQQISVVMKASCAVIIIGPVTGLIMIAIAIYFFVQTVKLTNLVEGS